jgi:uncharacterized LabA/DUF88 family protein
MTQTPLDSSVPADPSERGANGAAPEAASATPTRRRHRRPAARRGAPAVERAPENAAEAQAADGAAAHDVAEAAAAPAAPAPAPSPASEETPQAAQAAPTRAARGERVAGRRPGRARTPRLVPSARAEGEPAAPAASEAPGPGATPLAAEAAVEVTAASPDSAPDQLGEPGAVPEAAAAWTRAEQPTPETAGEPAFEANIETVSPAEVADAVENTAPPARVRRYRFDRPARAGAPSAPLRPERLTSAGSATPAESAPPADDLLSPITVPAVAPDAVPQVAEPLGSPSEALAPDADAAFAPREDLSGLGETPGEGSPEEADAGVATLEGTGAGPAAPEGEGGQPARRRRRRRRNGAGGVVRHLEAVVPTEAGASEPTPISASAGPRPAQSAADFEESLPGYGPPPDELPGAGEQRPADAYAPHTQPYQIYPPYQQDAWSVSNAYQQLNQPRSPFGAPEPNTPRGFGSQPQGIAAPFQEHAARGARGDRVTDVPPMSANQLSAVITQAIQQQTDRLLTELRHTSAPPSMTVMFPPFPSTERVGVFVDVANLLYSSRSLRVSLDFGRLLEFLRGNRRLVRAHAYAPTSPEPRAEQQFLSVVKGVGYRITTKNYKTFSSGAKKADLDLDLCMDIVRLVDARALDTVVLVSGDSDFLPLLEYCSDRGVRVEVAAFEDAASMILRQSCDLFINLSLVEDIRA